MTSAQVVKTSVTVTDNSPFQDCAHADDHTSYTIEPCTVLRFVYGFLLGSGVKGYNNHYIVEQAGKRTHGVPQKRENSEMFGSFNQKIVRFCSMRSKNKGKKTEYFTLIEALYILNYAKIFLSFCDRILPEFESLRSTSTNKSNSNIGIIGIIIFHS